MRCTFLFLVFFGSAGFAVEKHAPIYFPFDSSNIPLKRLNLKSFETSDYFLIQGYTDPSGDESYNLQLSKERAENVRRKIISQYNVEGSHIKVTFYGEDKDTSKRNEFKRRAEITSGSLSDINLIMGSPGVNLSSDPADISEYKARRDEGVKVLGIEPQSEKGLSTTNNELMSSENLQKENKLGKRHDLFFKLNSFHSELAGVQTSGVGVGSVANEILTDPSFSGELSYGFKLSKSLKLRAMIDLKHYIFSEDLDSKIVEEQKHLAVNPGIGIIYNVNDKFNISLDLYSFEQAFYGANSLGNLIFDYERLLRFELHPEYLILTKRRYDLGLGVIGTYHIKKGDVSSAFGWGSEVFINAFYGKRFRFHVKYYDVEYDFVSSEIKNELLELGVGYKWTF